MKVEKGWGKKLWGRLSIRWRLLLYFAGFAAVMLGLLWTLQVVLLDPFYQAITVADVRKSSAALSRQLFSPDIEQTLETLAADNQVCAMVVTSDGQVVASADTLPDCLLHRMRARELFALYTLAVENGGSFFQEFKWSEASDWSYPTRVVLEQKKGIVNVELAQNAQGEQRILLVNAMITPVNATVRTLRVQLLLVTGVMLVLAVVLAYLLSRKIARPVMDINASARALSGGQYTPYTGNGYREVMELDATLTRAAADLNRVEQLRRELLANISHDLRTPLTMITGYAEVMRDLPGENTPENVQIIIDEANHLTQLVNDLLDLSKLQAGTVSLTLTRFNFTELVRSTLLRYQKLTEKNGYVLSFEAGEDAWVEADQTRISQVIYNLINNAIHYTGDTKVITLRQEIGQDSVRLDVIDNGEGIPEDQLPLVWERYYKIDKVHRRSTVGTGLGLSIVQSVLELHHAQYGVTSQVGKGSDFWFSLKTVTPEKQNSD